MRKIAYVRARALDDLAVGVNQRILFARERRDLLREAPLQSLGGAGTDRRQGGRNALQGREAEANLEHGGEQQRGREYAEGDDERAIERLSLVLDLLRIACHGDQISP